MARALAGRQVAVALEKAEAALDQAVADVAGLAALLPGARLRAELTAVTGQKVFEGASETLSLVAQARGRLVETHRRLDALNKALGSQVATGPTDKPEEDRPRDGGGIVLERIAV
jgi:hypothetical protein